MRPVSIGALRSEIRRLGNLVAAADFYLQELAQQIKCTTSGAEKALKVSEKRELEGARVENLRRISALKRAVDTATARRSKRNTDHG